MLFKPLKSTKHLLLKQTQENRSRNICFFLLKVKTFCRNWALPNCSVDNIQPHTREHLAVYHPAMLTKATDRSFASGNFKPPWQHRPALTPGVPHVQILMLKPTEVLSQFSDSCPRWLLTVSRFPPPPSLKLLSLHSQHKYPSFTGRWI